MKKVHMQSRNGRRGHKWFPSMPQRQSMPPIGLIPAIVAMFLRGSR